MPPISLDPWGVKPPHDMTFAEQVEGIIGNRLTEAAGVDIFDLRVEDVAVTAYVWAVEWTLDALHVAELAVGRPVGRIVGRIVEAVL